MQPQYSQGAAPSHHPPPYAPPEVSQANGGSITSSLRQWRKKDYVEKQPSTDQPQTSVADNPSHVARVAPNIYYSRPTNDVCHYQHQYSEYGVPYKPAAPTPVKYSEIVDNPQAQTVEHITSVVPKLKDKEFGDLCSVAPQPHMKQYQDPMTMKQSYSDGTKQTYSDPTIHHQYISKESQIHPFLQKQSQMHQYIQKEPYQQYLPKYSMQGQFSQSYPSEPNNFLAHLNKINPRMAQSIINDTHLRDPQIPMYHSLEQNRSYPQPQRMYHTPSMHSSPTHVHRNIQQSYNYPQPYNYNVKSSMQPNDPYNRVHQYQHNVPKYLPDYKMNAAIDQPIPNISPQRMFNESVHMNYAPMPPKISPNYPHCSQLEYAQHYQHRRAHLAQEFYSQSGYKSGYVHNPQISPEGVLSDGRTRKSSLKQYLETWVEEDMSGNLPDLVVSSNNLNDVETMENLKGTMCLKGSGTQETPLYVLDTTEIPNENLPHFLHLQQFEKLPDNIRGYYQPTTALPPGRRIIIDNNSSDGLPENNQVIRGNSAPIMPKLSEGFTETIVNQSAAENQRKIIASEEPPVHMGKRLENQIQNLEDKVVQIHIIEESEAPANNNLNSDITATLTTHQRTTTSPADTVIIQSNVYQHNPLQSIMDSNTNCVIKKQNSLIVEESVPSVQPESDIPSEDAIKNMPVIDESSIAESTKNDETKEEVFVPPKDTASTQNSVHAEEIVEDLQASETASSRRSSICSIYKEMENIHGENNHIASETTSIKNCPENLVNPIIPEPVQEDCNPVYCDSDKANDLQENTDQLLSTANNNNEENKVDELNAKDKHSKLEPVYSQNCDASNDTPTDLTFCINLENPLSVSKDKIELSDIESTKNTFDTDLQNTVLENESHRQISKKLRTAKTNTPLVSEESSSEDATSTVEELLATKELLKEENTIKSATEEIVNLEDENDSMKVAEITPLLEENAKETNCTEKEDGNRAFKTILQIPKAKINTNCVINQEDDSESLISTKELVLDEPQNEIEIPEPTKGEHMLKEIENTAVIPIEDISMSNNNNQPSSNTGCENTCHTIEDLIGYDKNEDTMNVANTENILPDESFNSNEIDECIELENVKNEDCPINLEKVGEENCEESISTNTTENVIFLPKSDDDESFFDEENFTDYVQTTTPLNLSLEKRFTDIVTTPKNTTVYNNYHHDQTDTTDEIYDPLSVKLEPEICNPENLSLSIEKPKKVNMSEIRDNLNTRSTKKHSKSMARKKESNQLVKENSPSSDEINLHSNTLVVSQTTKDLVDIAETRNTLELEKESDKVEDTSKHVSKSTSLPVNVEETLNVSEALNSKVPTSAIEAVVSSLQEEILQSVNSDSSTNDEKAEMPELESVLDPKSNVKFVESNPLIIEEDPKSINNLITLESEMNDNAISDKELSDATMPILKCMVNYTQSSKNSCNFGDPPKCINSTKIRKKSAARSKHSKTANLHAVLENFTSPKKIQARTPAKNKYREKVPQKHSEMRRKSRRLHKNSFTINSESAVEQQILMPHLMKESTDEVEGIIVELESTNNECENVQTCIDTIDFAEPIVDFSETVEEDCTLQSNIEETEAGDQVDNSANNEKVVEQSLPLEQEPLTILDNVREEETISCIQEEEPESDLLEESLITEEIINNPEDDFENSDPSIVYQIDDTNVVLQIADELLEINVTTQNGRKIISVKTFSDAVVMNNSEENSEQQRPCITEEFEKTNENIETLHEKICETPLNNNHINDEKNSNADIEEEANLCFKEICTATDITTVGDDVFIYNEEVVSSSTEIETVTKPPNNKEEETQSIIDDTNLQKKYVTRKSSKKEKKVSWVDIEQNLDIKCLITDGSPTKLPKDDTVQEKVHSNLYETNYNKKSTTIKDSLRKSPKTKAALKFVEAVKPPKSKEPKVPSKSTDTSKTNPINETPIDKPIASVKDVTKLLKKEHNTIKQENLSCPSIKNTPKQKYRSQNIVNKTESHINSSKNKLNDVQIKLENIPKIKQTIVAKDCEKAKEIKVQVKSKRNQSPKEEKPLKLIPTSHKKPKIDNKIIEESRKKATSRVQSENKKKQKPTPGDISSKNVKGNIKKESKKEIIQQSKPHKETQNKINKNKSSKEQPKTLLTQTAADKQITVLTEEPPTEEKQISVQENSITSSTSQETEALIKQRSSKLIQQITDDWDDDFDDIKSTESSNKRRLSLQEYNSRKRTNSTAEHETIPPCEENKPDLTDNLLSASNILIGNKCKREISPESPILSVKFNNKTYSRSSSLYSLKSSTISDHEQDANPKETSAGAILNYSKEEPLSSAIELHLPRINRSPKPAYSQEYLRNALMHDLQAVNAVTTSLIKEHQQLMLRFLEQKRLTAEELTKVKTIIRYKRLVQHLSTIRINEMQTTSVRSDSHPTRSDTDNLLFPFNTASHLKFTSNLNPTDNFGVNRRQSNVNQIINISEINQLHPEEPVKVNLEKRKKKRFRFLYSDEETEPNNSSTISSATVTFSDALKRPRLDDAVLDVDPNVMDYSVHQSNSLTLVFKRSFKSDPKMQPFVKLERLPSIDLLAKNRLY